MLEVKNNFRGKHKDITCRACKMKPETQEHVLEECQQIHKEESSKVTKQELNSCDLSQLKLTSQKVRKIIETLTEGGKLKSLDIASSRKKKST